MRATAFAALERLLKLLHPVMPHVTEEIWTNLPARETRLIVAPWPEPETVGGRVRDDRERTDGGAHLPAQRRSHQARRAIRRASSRRSCGRASDGQGDVEAERARVQKEIERAERMLANEKFVANAAPEAVAAEREKLAQYLAERDALG